MIKNHSSPNRSLGHVFTCKNIVIICSLFSFGFGYSADHPPSLEEMKKWNPHALRPEHAAVFELHANKGDGDSAWMLHKYYAHKHDPKAIKYLVLAAELGVPQAQCGYYSVLVQSSDPKTRESSVDWLRKAAKGGYQPAIEYLKDHEQVLKMYEELHTKEKNEPKRK